MASHSNTSNIPSEEPEQKDEETLLKEAFDRISNYEFVRCIGEGCDGTAYLMQRKLPSGTEPTRIVVKVSGFLRDAEWLEWMTEHKPEVTDPFNDAKLPLFEKPADFLKNKPQSDKVLQTLANSTHAAKWVYIDPDPAKSDRNLTSDICVVAYMNWLPNGDVAKFRSALLSDGTRKPVPNRLMWRFFLCWLRGICAIVWPESLEAGKMEEPQLDDAKVSLDWGPDVPNFGNWAFDEFTADETGHKEHFLSPPLCLIDCDRATVNLDTTEYQRDHSQIKTLLEYARELLEELALLRRREPEKDPRVDLDLRNIIVSRPEESKEPRQRLMRWMNTATEAIRTRDQEYYATNLGITDDSEADETIRRLVKEKLLDPSEARDLPDHEESDEYEEDFPDEDFL
ncbi:hypothetical protein E8E14_012621 [Neopestalotiopsis sp. 37M]|nr:hypothetical protein E8E14_012621 [Neopestalotiopsis sp. 37M]